MTIKWVQQDPLVMNGEPFCYGSRLTVRQLLELRANGYDLTRILTDHPELRAARHRRGVHVYAAAIASATPTSSSRTARSPGPGYTRREAAGLPAQYRAARASSIKAPRSRPPPRSISARSRRPVVRSWSDAPEHHARP